MSKDSLGERGRQGGRQGERRRGREGEDRGGGRKFEGVHKNTLLPAVALNQLPVTSQTKTEHP